MVTAHTATGGRAAFAVDLRAAGVTCDVPEWTSRGLREIPSGTVHFDGVPAVPLGGDGWYFQRPGFAWGGMGVAACWLGGAVALGRHFEAALQRGARSQREPDQVALAALGEVDRILTSTVQYLARAADAVDGRAAWPAPPRRTPDFERGQSGRRRRRWRVERGAPCPGNCCRRRRTRPAPGEPEPGARARWPSTNGTANAWRTCPSTCGSTTQRVTTPSWAHSPSRGSTHGDVLARGRRHR